MSTTTLNYTKTQKKYIVILPTEGRPYISSEVCKRPRQTQTLIDYLVGGQAEQTPYGYYTIHPMFAETRQWDIARMLLTSKQVLVFGNGDGMYNCSPNFALLHPGKEYEHSWGDEILIVPEKVLKTLNVSVDELQPEPEDSDDEEEDDDEDSDDEVKTNITFTTEFEGECITMSTSFEGTNIHYKYDHTDSHLSIQQVITAMEKYLPTLFPESCWRWRIMDCSDDKSVIATVWRVEE